MSVLNYDEYSQYKTGVSVSEEEFDILYLYAETAFLAYTGLKKLPENDGVIKRALAFQISYSKMNGGVDYYNDTQQTGGSESLGKYSYSTTASSGSTDNKGVFPFVANMLFPYVVRGNIVPVVVKL